jgi:hypothetical protein
MIDKSIIGIWRLKNTKTIASEGVPLPPPFGPAPNGVMCFQPDGRMYCVLCDGRVELPPGVPRQFMSYAGNYTFNGSILSTLVDASSDAKRIGTNEVRNIRFESSDEMALLPPSQLVAGVTHRKELLWERVYGASVQTE